MLYMLVRSQEVICFMYWKSTNKRRDENKRRDVRSEEMFKLGKVSYSFNTLIKDNINQPFHCLLLFKNGIKKRVWRWIATTLNGPNLHAIDCKTV